jgi:hypothetical protein
MGLPRGDRWHSGVPTDHFPKWRHGFRDPQLKKMAAVARSLGAMMATARWIGATGQTASANGTNLASLSVDSQAIGDCIVLSVEIAASGHSVANVSGGGCTWSLIRAYESSTAAQHVELWLGAVVAAGSSTITISYSSAPGVSCELNALELTIGAAASWSVDVSAAQYNTSASAVAFPSLKPSGTGELYVGYAWGAEGSSGGMSTGLDAAYATTSGGNLLAWYGNTSSALGPAGSQSPNGVSLSIAALLTAAPAAQVPGLVVGVSPGNLSSLSGGQLATWMSGMKAAGATWVRLGADWDTSEATQGSYSWTASDLIIEAALNADLSVLFLVGGSGDIPSWATSPWVNLSTFVSQYAAFAAACAAHYSASPFYVHAYEIYNEPNLGTNWDGIASGTQYGALLQSAYTAVKAADPASFVIGGVLSAAGDAARTAVASGSNGANVSAITTLYVASTSDFSTPTGTIEVVTSTGTAEFNYTGVTSTSFTGCTLNSGTGTVATNNVVAQGGSADGDVAPHTFLSQMYCNVSAVGGLVVASATGSVPALTVSPVALNDLIVLTIGISASYTVSSVSGGGVDTWRKVGALTGAVSGWREEMWMGPATSLTAGALTIAFTGSPSLSGVGVELSYQEFASGYGSHAVWAVDKVGSQENTGSTAVTYPSLSPAGTAELCIAYAFTATAGDTGPTPGFVWEYTAYDRLVAFNAVVSATVQPASSQDASGWSDVVMALITATSSSGGPTSAKGSFDAISAHPYCWPYDAVDSSTAQWNFLYNVPTWIYDVMVANGDGAKQIWNTEWGDPYDSGDGESQVTQAQHLVDSFDVQRFRPWAGPCFYYCWQDQGDNFGLLDGSGTARLALAAFEDIAIPVPAVISVSPSSGSAGGGTSVTIIGTNLTGATAVHFGATPAVTYSVNSSTSITATAPPHAAGAVDITVTAANGTSATSSADLFTYTAPIASRWPSLSCRVGFASNPFDPSITWTELGPASGAGPGGKGWLRSVATKRGRERLLRSQSQFQAGTMVAALDNRARQFDPENTSSPYWPNVQPEKIVQIGATWAGVFYPVWTGYIDDWPQSWPGFSEGEVALPATDLFKHLSIMRMLSSGYVQQLLSLGPTAYYRLGDPVGSTVAADSSGNNRYASIAGGVTFGVTPGAMPADPGTAATFAAATSDVAAGQLWLPDVGFESGIQSGATVICWFNGTGIELGIIIDQDGFFRLMTTAPGKVIFAVGSDTVDGATTMTDGNWHMIVATCGLDSGGMQLYIDGNLDGSSALQPGSWPTPWTGIVVGNSADTQTLQELAFFQQQLTAAQVAALWRVAAFPAQYTGQMAKQLVDVLGLPTSLQSRIDTGRTWCQADTEDETQTKVLDQLQKLEQTEQGQCFVDPAGNLVFQDRYHRYEYPNLTPAATFGDGGSAHPSELPYVMGGVKTSFDRVELYNDIPVTRRGGVLQEAFNAASIEVYTNRTMTGLSDLMMAADADALYCAQWILADTAYPQLRVEDLVLDPVGSPALWPYVLGLDIGAVITVNKHNIPGGGPALSVICRIEGVEHQIDPPRSWRTTWHLSLVGTLPWFILGDPVAGLLDHGNRWAW